MPSPGLLEERRREQALPPAHQPLEELTTALAVTAPPAAPAANSPTMRLAKHAGVDPPATFSRSSSDSAPASAGFAGKTMCQEPAGSSCTTMFGRLAAETSRYLTAVPTGSAVNSWWNASFSQQRLTILASRS